MFTAKEAREKAEKSISDETKEQLEYAEKCIEFAVGKGEMKCRYGKKLGKQAMGKLEGLGYTVKDRSNQRDGVEYEISWQGGVE